MKRIALAATLACLAGTAMADPVDGIWKTQPGDAPSAGCIFRNPPGKYAGMLIEEAGLKGRKVGGAEVSSVHANYVMNRGDASGSDVRELIDLIVETVKDRSGVTLEVEVDIW